MAATRTRWVGLVCCLLPLVIAGCAGAPMVGWWISLLVLSGSLAIATLSTGCDDDCANPARDCVDGRWVKVCCPEGASCNYGLGARDCGDGTCSTFPPTPACPGPGGSGGTGGSGGEAGTAGIDAGACDGAWEQGCVDGALVQLCCPAGLACNYGQGITICDDGSCTPDPNMCPDACDEDASAACFGP